MDLGRARGVGSVVTDDNVDRVDFGKASDEFELTADDGVGEDLVEMTVATTEEDAGVYLGGKGSVAVSNVVRVDFGKLSGDGTLSTNDVARVGFGKPSSDGALSTDDVAGVGFGKMKGRDMDGVETSDEGAVATSIPAGVDMDETSDVSAVATDAGVDLRRMSGGNALTRRGMCCGDTPVLPATEVGLMTFTSGVN